MSSSNTANAIGAVTRLLVFHLSKTVAGISDVSVGRPEPPPSAGEHAKLNLFLYETSFDPHLKNTEIFPGKTAPLWLILRYIMTAFDESGESDSISAHEILGRGIQALQGLSFLPLTGNSAGTSSAPSPLSDNPEALKVTFVDSSFELLHKLMQGTDEKYRFSISFEVRPVMIDTTDPPTYSLLVGIDNTTIPSRVIAEKGIILPVLPSIAPAITSLTPATFELNSVVEVRGTNLGSATISVFLDDNELPKQSQDNEIIKCSIDENVFDLEKLTAGSHSIHVVEKLLDGKQRASSILVGFLLPSLVSVNTDTLTRINAGDPDSNVFGNINMNGVLLGTDSSDIIVALYQQGRTVKVFDKVTIIPPASPAEKPQSKIKLEIKENDAIPPGKYNIILVVNQQRARNSPQVELVVP